LGSQEQCDFEYHAKMVTAEAVIPASAKKHSSRDEGAMEISLTIAEPGAGQEFLQLGFSAP